jgi:SAM-dependent methyltransferase
MDERAYYAAQERKSEAKVAWEYGRLLRLAGLRPPRGRRVLDAGCGAGPGLRFFSSWGNRVLGLDRSFYALQRARQLVPEAGLVQGDLAGGLPFAGESFDLVLLGDVLEHLDGGQALLSECRRVLRPGGVLLVRTVNRWDLRRFFQGRRWSGRADPGHIRLYSPPELRRALQAAGFQEVRVRTGVKPLFWLPLRWKVGLPGPPLLGNGLVGMGRRC